MRQLCGKNLGDVFMRRDKICNWGFGTGWNSRNTHKFSYHSILVFLLFWKCKCLSIESSTNILLHEPHFAVFAEIYQVRRTLAPEIAFFPKICLRHMFQQNVTKFRSFLVKFLSDNFLQNSNSRLLMCFLANRLFFVHFHGKLTFSHNFFRISYVRSAYGTTSMAKLVQS